MKILMIFIDMIGSQYLNTCNNNTEKNSFDSLLEKMGGTIYKNCYSPAPDTQRGSACMWSGLYPRANGCDTRVKWPATEMNKEIDNMWKMLDRNGYDVNIFTHQFSIDLGLIPQYDNQNIYTVPLNEFLSKTACTDKMVDFVYLPDLHFVLDETGYSDWGYKDGIKFLTELVEEILYKTDAKNKYDYIMMYSDHGFQMHESKYIICDERANTFMYLWKKSETKLHIDNKLRSNLDVFPTICDVLGCKIENQVDGISLLSENGHEHLLIEDLDDYTVRISQSVEHWCVIDKDLSKHWLECSGIWEHEDSEKYFDENVFLSIIKNKMSDYERNSKVYASVQRYKNYWREHSDKDTYSNGEDFWVLTYEMCNYEYLFGKNIILYGAGNVGKAVCKQLLQQKNINIIGWIDLNYEKISEMYGIKISGLSEVKRVCDYILVCIESESIFYQIKNMLLQLGVNSEKIVRGNFKKIRVKRDV
jgi:hypothetical protein